MLTPSSSALLVPYVPTLSCTGSGGVDAIRAELPPPVPPDVDVLLSALEVHVLAGEAHVNVVDGFRDTFLELAAWHGLDWNATARALAAFASLRCWVARAPP